MGNSHKYANSIGEFVNLAKALKGQYESIQDKVLKIDESLQIDGLYASKDNKDNS